jgi:ferredoxin--NADP+ reductase
VDDLNWKLLRTRVRFPPSPFFMGEKLAKAKYNEKVTALTHYNDSLFSFRITRPDDLHFTPGQFIMIGLEIDQSPVMRAYSIASSTYDEELEFYSIKIPDGELTSQLQNIKIGDDILMSAKAVGNLTIWDLRPGKRLYLFSTGTGLAPFGSIIRDPDTYEKFEEVILTHTCRHIEDLKYGADLIEASKKDPLCGENIQKKLRYYPTTTREESPYCGRITDLVSSSKISVDLNLPPVNNQTDRVMICGSMEMVKDMVNILENKGLSSSSGRNLGDIVFERAYVG